MLINWLGLKGLITIRSIKLNASRSHLRIYLLIDNPSGKKL